MQVLSNAPQGSAAWHAARAGRFCASEAAAAMGVSMYTTRDALLYQKATGITEDVGPAKQRIFDAGHAAEAAERRRQDQHAAAQRAAEQAEATERAAAVIAQAECPTNDALEHAHHDALTTGCGLVRMHSTGEAEHIAPEQFRDAGERINLGAINEHLAPISINAAGLAALGFEPVAVVKASKLYRATDLPAIRDALIAHLESLHDLQAAMYRAHGCSPERGWRLPDAAHPTTHPTR